MLMVKNSVRRLPVVVQDELVGIITETDIARFAARLGEPPSFLASLTNKLRLGEGPYM